MGTNQLQNSLIVIIVALLMLLGSLFAFRPVALADWPTVTPAGPTPTIPNFYDPLYSEPPTLIPDVSLPDVDRMPTPPPTVTYQPPTIEPPDLPTITLSATPVSTLAAISSTIEFDYNTPSPLSYEANLSGSAVISNVNGMLMGTQSTISGVVSYTNSLSNTIFEIALATDTLASGSAPDWYAPPLPRPIADIGWRFEEMGQDTRKRYSVASWGLWAVDILAVPVKLIKGLAPIAQLLGPFGLFLLWLLIMTPIVFLFKALSFLKDLVIQIFNFIIEVVKFILSFIPFFG